LLFQCLIVCPIKCFSVIYYTIHETPIGFMIDSQNIKPIIRIY